MRCYIVRIPQMEIMIDADNELDAFYAATNQLYISDVEISEIEQEDNQ